MDKTNFKNSNKKKINNYYDKNIYEKARDIYIDFKNKSFK